MCFITVTAATVLVNVVYRGNYRGKPCLIRYYPVVVTGGYELATPTIVKLAPTIALDTAGVCSERALCL